MNLLVFSSLLIAAAALPTEPPGGNLCTYKAVGDESTQDAVPIADFRTSGQDFVRPSWCITHCADRTSIKAAARFQFANTSSAVPTYKVRHTITREHGLKSHKELISGTPVERDDDPFNFCMDDAVADQIDQIVATYPDIETMSEALNYFINKPGWAYLIFDMGPPPSIVGTSNVKHDMNYCEKFSQKQLPDGSWGFYQVFAGLIKN